MKPYWMGRWTKCADPPIHGLNIPPAPLGGFTLTNGHFVYRCCGDTAHTLCGQIVTDVTLDMDGQASCKRCRANVVKWSKRAPKLMR